MANWSQGGQGALGGAATGAMVGSVVPGIGTAFGAGAGAVIGGLGGLFGGGGRSQGQYNLPGYDERQRALNQQIGGYNGPQIGPMQSASMGGQFREQQLALMQQLQNQANGQGPSMANMAANQARQESINQQVAGAQSGLGNQALAGRNALANIGQTNQAIAQQEMMGRLAEQQAAQQALGQLATAGRGQELQGSQFNAGQFNNAALAQAQMGMNYNMGLRELELRNAQLQQAGMMGYANTQGPGMGTQILNGAGTLGANYFNAQLGNSGEFGTNAQMQANQRLPRWNGQNWVR